MTFGSHPAHSILETWFTSGRDPVIQTYLEGLSSYRLPHSYQALRRHTHVERQRPVAPSREDSRSDMMLLGEVSKMPHMQCTIAAKLPCRKCNADPRDGHHWQDPLKSLYLGVCPYAPESSSLAGMPLLHFRTQSHPGTPPSITGTGCRG